jgi:hypothetical protein
MYRLLRLVLVTVLVSLLLIIVWSLDRGLDITDESMSLLLYQHPDEYRWNNTTYYLIVSRVTGWMRPTVLAYRWMTLALLALAATVFAYGFCQWLGRFFQTGLGKAANLTLVFPFILIGRLSLYGLGVRTLEYNGINSVLLSSASGLLLYVFSKESINRAQPLTGIALFMVGVLSALDLFVKFPTAILMFGAALFLIVVHMRRRGPRKIILAIGILIFGAMAGLAVYFVGVQSFSTWLPRYRIALQATSQGNHSTSSILSGYVSNVEALVWVLIRHFSFAFLLSFVIARCYSRGWHRKVLRNQYVLIALLAITVGYTGYKVWILDLLDSPYFNGLVTFYILVLIVCFQVIVLVATNRNGPAASGPRRVTARRSEVLPGIALLALLPFAGAFGTGNSIFLNAMFGIAAWFGLILVLGLFIKERTGSRWALALCILLPTCFVAAQVTYGTVWQPYMLATTLPNQTVTLHQPASVAGLKVDSATAEFLTELRSTLRQGSFQEQDYIIGLYNIPGLVYLAGGVSPGMPTYFGGDYARICRALAEVDFSKRSVFVLATTEAEPQIAACMHKAGLRFPEGFVELGQIYNPYSASSYGWRPGPWVRVFRQNGRQ